MGRTERGYLAQNSTKKKKHLHFIPLSISSLISCSSVQASRYLIGNKPARLLTGTSEGTRKEVSRSKCGLRRFARRTQEAQDLESEERAPGPNSAVNQLRDPDDPD